MVTVGEDGFQIVREGVWYIMNANLTRKNPHTEIIWRVGTVANLTSLVMS